MTCEALWLATKAENSDRLQLLSPAFNVYEVESNHDETDHVLRHGECDTLECTGTYVNQIRAILPFGLCIRSADQQRPNIVTLTSCLTLLPILFGFGTAAACFQSDHSLAKIG